MIAESWRRLSYGQLATRTMSAVMRHFAHRDEHACHDFLTWFDDAEMPPIASLFNK